MNAQVKLAKEVLNLIELEQIAVTQNTYIRVDGKQFLDIAYYNPAYSFDTNGNVPQLLEQIKKEKTSCEVCALGSIFLAACNGHPIPRQWDDMMGILKDYFDIKSLALIEFAFEGSLVGIITEGPFEETHDHWDEDGAVYNYIVESDPDMSIFNDEILECKIFYNSNKNPKIRLQKIMQNIIDNGKFVLGKLK